jgi:hypothetical protein
VTNIIAALDWIDRHGDRDGDGFVDAPPQRTRSASAG